MNTSKQFISPDLSIVCPVYCEESTVSSFYRAVIPVLESTGRSFELIFINDGSTDDTLAKLLELQKSDLRIRILDLSRNFGKEAALTCGIEYARGRAIIPIDVDLQDPPELISDMLNLWQNGFDVVLAQRIDRSSDHWLKRKTANWFYAIFNLFSNIKIPPNVGDFRLMDRKVVDALKQLPERRRFMKGLFAWLGFRQVIIPYTRRPRSKGKSKFSGWKLWNFALEGITSFSDIPLQIWTYIGFVIALISFLYGLFIIGKVLLFGRDVPGYASLMTVILFLGGIQLMGLGILGRYLGGVYSETKKRPLYIVRKEYSNSNQDF